MRPIYQQGKNNEEEDEEKSENFADFIL